MTQKIFNGLNLLSKCGSGAFGEVWYCEDLSGRRMAVKIVSKTHLGDAWKRELQGVINYRRITENSPYLLQIFHVAEDEKCFYYTMEAADNAGGEDEYIPDTLARRLHSGPLPPEQLYPAMLGIFGGIKTIHEAGLAHRDIKPDNIIFANGVPKLSDIGLVSSLSNSLTRLAGTLDFLPPEVRTSPGSADRASRQRNDLYAFGKVIYCAATGMDASDYPSIPTRAELSPEFKFFIQLSFGLCAGRQGLRIASVEALDRNMKRIGRELKCGGKRPPLGWKIRHLADRIAEWMRRHMLLLLLLVAILAAAAATLPRLIGEPAPPKPEPPVTSTPEPPPPEPQQQSPTVEYKVDPPGLKMRVPRQWQIMSDDYIRSMVDEMTKELNETRKSEEAKKYLRHAIAKAKTWRGMIRCDLYDTIEIAQEPPSAKMNNLWTLPEAQLRREILAQCGAPRENNAVVYEVKRMMLAGRRCVAVDFTADRHDRIKSYMLLDDGGLVSIALTADAATFDRRVKEFDAMLATLEFTRPLKAAPRKAAGPPPDGDDYSFDASTRTKTFASKSLKFNMRIPEDWGIYLKEDRPAADPASERFDSLKRPDYLAALSVFFGAKAISGVIFCDSAPEWFDTVSFALEPGNIRVDASAAPLRLDGRPAVMEESSPERDKNFIVCHVRVNYDKSHCLLIRLKAKKRTYEEHKKQLLAALKTLKFSTPPLPQQKNFDAKKTPATGQPDDNASSSSFYDLSKKEVVEMEIGGNSLDNKYFDDRFVAEVEIPKSWHDGVWLVMSFEKAAINDKDKSLYDLVFPGMHHVFAIDSRYMEKADTTISKWESYLLTKDDFRRLSDEQLKLSVRKDFYLEYALPNANFAKQFLNGPEVNTKISDFLKKAEIHVPEKSISVGEIKRFFVSGQPALYMEITSPLTHGQRKLLYCLISVKGLKYCTVLLLDADAKKAALRTKQFFEFCRHITIFLK